MPNRWYQNEILRQALALWHSERRRTLIQLPTGGGKTRIAVQLVDKVGFRRVLYVVPSVEIFSQTSAKLDDLKLPHTRLEAGDFPDLSRTRVTLAMTETLDRRLASGVFANWKPDVIIVDEIHRRFDQIKRLLKKFPGAAVAGLSATPTRLDGKDLRELCPTMILGPSVCDLQSEGYLVPSRTVPDVIPDLTGVQVLRNEFDAAAVEDAYFESGILSYVPQAWLQHAKGRRTITFAPGVRASKVLVEAYNRYGVRAVHIDGTTSDYLRDEALERLREHDIDVLSNVGLFVEGLDVVEVECITSLRPSQSVAFHLQSLGRGLRLSPKTGKKDLLIIDHSGNTVRHGLVEAERDWTNGGMAKYQTLSRCRACGSAKATLKCPFCGWEDKERRGSKVWNARREKEKSLNTPPRPCPSWARAAQGFWLQVERQRAKDGLPLPRPEMGQEGYTESMVRRRLFGSTRGRL